MPAHAYPVMMAMIASQKLKPELLVSETISLSQSISALTQMGEFKSLGVTVIDQFHRA